MRLMFCALFATIVFCQNLSAEEKPAVAENYLKLAAEIEANLQQHVLQLWYPRAIDKENGGFAQIFREDWSPGENTVKSIVYQSRLTWMAASAALRYPDRAAEFNAYAKHGLDFLHDKMWDREYGGFFWSVDQKGAPKLDRGGEKHVYGISFGLYAACAVYKSTKEERALDLAKRTFNWLEENSHDNKNDGFIEALTRSGEPIVKVPASGPAGDMISTRYGFKSMNSHIHLLESYTALYEIWPDGKVKNRLKELLEVVRDKVAVEPGCLNLYFTLDWKPVPDHDSFGHDVETSYLIVEASTALGHPEDKPTWAMARMLVDHALEFGWDNDNGGIYDKGSAFKTAYDTAKIWWVQAESLNALLLMHEKFGAETPKYWNAFLKQWNFIQKFQIDAKYRGWLNTVSKEGEAKPGRNKSDAWTEAYHQGRALLNVEAMLKKLAKH
jgi:cellobiose epimerase